jgi:histidinol-phosphate/aromatic aminotransferase/cobyric acid decarboxylase-like protein
VLVNPNSPTGRHLPAAELREVLRGAPAETRIWIDETYIDYVGGQESLESFATSSRNVVVCKSMSKVYALSGLRAAYLCAPQAIAAKLRAITPPWAVSLPAQVAAVNALLDSKYYAARYAQTHRLRGELMHGLSELGFEVTPAVANFLLCELPRNTISVAELVRRCREQKLFLRDVSNMGVQANAVRIAVKDDVANAQMLRVIREVLAGSVVASLQGVAA